MDNIMIEFCTCDQQTIHVGNKETIEGRIYFICCNCKKPISKENEMQCNLRKNSE